MRYYIHVIWLLIFALVSCNNDSKTYLIGDDAIDTDTRVIQIDTLTLNASTIILDSLVTSSKERILVGSYNDENFGRITSKSYFEFVGDEYEIDDKAVFDSIGLILRYDSYYYGDTLQPQTLKIQKITEDFTPEEGSSFYNTSKLKLDDEVLGELTFTPQPTKKDSIYIPLSKSFGVALFNDIIENNVNSNDDLLKTVNGLAILPDTLSNNVLGFGFKTNLESDHNSVIRLYYNVEKEYNEDNNYKDFYITGAAKQFNQIQSDFSNTLLSDITSIEDIKPTSSTNQKSYIQSGSGVCMRIEIPYLINLNKLENNSTNLSASLKIYPVNNSYKNTSSIDSLAVYVIDHKNRMIEQLTNFGGDNVYALLNTSSYNEFNDTSYYTVDINAYIEQVLSGSYNSNYALLFLLPDYDKSVDKLLLHDATSSDNKMKLSVIYLTY